MFQQSSCSKTYMEPPSVGNRTDLPRHKSFLGSFFFFFRNHFLSKKAISGISGISTRSPTPSKTMILVATQRSCKGGWLKHLSLSLLILSILSHPVSGFSLLSFVSAVPPSSSSSSSSFCPSTITSTTTSSLQMTESTTEATKATKTTSEEDPYTWLEDVESEESLNFAKSANDKCLKALGDPKDGPSYQRILDVLESKDRIPHVGSHGIDPKSGERIVYNFWKDESNPKGIWRKTTLSSYKDADNTHWTTVLDVDELAKKDDISWVWKGSTALPRSRDPKSEGLVTRCLLSLSRGGSDATHLKEFDMITGDFVAEDEAFVLPEAKTRASYKSRDALLVGSDFGPGSLTDSGYPRVIKEWTRNGSIEDAPIVFEGDATDVSVSAYIADERPWGGSIWQIHSRSMTFYTSKKWMAQLTPSHLETPKPDGLPEPEFKELQVQDDATLGYLGNLMIISLRSDWTPKDDGVTYKRGSVIYCPLDKFWENGKGAVHYTILFEPTERTAYEYWTCTKNYVVLSLMDTVKSKLQFYKICDNGNSLELVYEDKEAKIRASNVRPLDALENDDFWFTTSDYVTPSTLYLANATKVEEAPNKDGDGQDPFITEKLRTLPPQYDSSNLIVEQLMATSKDGTQIPYFVVKRKDMEYNGKNPTMLYGYGGFEISLGPHYIATSGLAWLERGGVYVEANIRGGGEFGPSWHQAALKENRNKAYEDFIAVGEHLTETGTCKPKTLCVRGGSNGGLLVGNMYVMRPDLFGAIHCAVPLLDMKRFHTLLAGASWMAEYGNPDTDDWDNFLYKYSPYHNIDPKVESYPPMLVTTSTRDDRVHPAHARKMVKKIEEMGKDKNWPIYYYENIEGGHGGAADAKQSAFMTSLAYDFMFDTLTKNAEAMD